MIHNIDIESIVIMMRALPAKYNTPTIKVAKGKYKLPTNFRSLVKRIINQ